MKTFLIFLRPTVDLYPAAISIEALSKQEATDKARLMYGKAVASIESLNQVNNDIRVYPFGSEVNYREYNDKDELVQIHTYPRKP